MARRCPRCDEELTERAFGATTLDGCSGCGGTWFDYQELNKITRDPNVALMDVERAFQQEIGPGTKGSMKCPVCAVPLFNFALPHTPDVPLDACPTCKGIWLDEGEMQKIAERIAAARQAPVPKLQADAPRYHARTCTAFLLSAPCPVCQTTNPAASLVCWQCGSALETRNVHRLCPRCDRPLEEHRCATRSETKVDVCHYCTGVWFEAGEIAAFYQAGIEAVSDIQRDILSGRSAALGIPGGRTVLRCPGCHYQMEPRAYGEGRTVQVDMCTYCRSMWLDAGELLSVYEMMQSGTFVLCSSTASDPWAKAI